MYTGFFLKQNQIHGPEGSIGSYVHNGTIVMPLSKPSAFYLVEAPIESVKHIYGPQGYTHYYIQDNHLYGPHQTLPWLIEDRSVDRIDDT